MPFAMLPLSRTALRKPTGYVQTWDWSKQSAIASGLKISSATFDITLAGVTSTHLTITNVVIDGTGKFVQHKLNDVSVVIGNIYEVTSQVTLEDGQVLPPRSILYEIVNP